MAVATKEQEVDHETPAYTEHRPAYPQRESTNERGEEDKLEQLETFVIQSVDKPQHNKKTACYCCGKNSKKEQNSDQCFYAHEVQPTFRDHLMFPMLSVA